MYIEIECIAKDGSLDKDRVRHHNPSGLMARQASINKAAREYGIKMGEACEGGTFALRLRTVLHGEASQWEARTVDVVLSATVSVR